MVDGNDGSRRMPSRCFPSSRGTGIEAGQLQSGARIRCGRDGTHDPAFSLGCTMVSRTGQMQALNGDDLTSSERRSVQELPRVHEEQ